ncbi:MAG: response regulator [Desulfococcaceae bacterium]|jgi:PAS domain S-box-containing protein|nr:response regulator [Desulfococcaceae bacterium]
MEKTPYAFSLKPGKIPAAWALLLCLFFAPSHAYAGMQPAAPGSGVLLFFALLLLFFLSVYIIFLRIRLYRAESKIRAENNHAPPCPDHAKEDILAAISQELRSPLIGVTGITDALLKGVAGSLNPGLRKNLLLIAGTCRRLSNMVNNIFDFNRLKDRDIRLKYRPVRIQEIADIVIAFSEPLLSGTGIRLQNRIDPDFPPLYADEDRLQQILYNLLDNAVCFRRGGGGDREVNISCRIREGDLAEISIHGSGETVFPEDPDKIPETGEWQEEFRNDDFYRCGIGLHVTRQLIEMHGGSIPALQEKGNRIVFTLPLSKNKTPFEHYECHTKKNAPCTAAGQNTPDADESQADMISCTREIKACFAEKAARILVVDDDPVHLQIVENFLIVQQYEVMAVSDGDTALEYLSREKKPDLILLDVVMPGKSGFEVCRQIREKYSPGEMPVIMLTAKNQVSDLVKGFECGASDYLTKPVSHRELISRVKTHVHLNFSDRALRESERKYREIFENVFDFWFSHDLEGNIIESNLPYKEEWGYKDEDVIGRNIRVILLPSNAEKFGNYMEDLLRKGKTEGIACCVTRDGVKKMLDYRAALICDEKGQAISIRGTARDVTERIQFEKEKAELEKQIRQTRKMQAIGTLAGGIAHDFNNILFPIIGYTEIALENIPPDSSCRGDLKEVLRAANRAAELVRQILTFARQTEDEWKPMQIRPIIKEVLKLLKASLPSTIEIREDIGEDTDSVLADPTQIHQIVMNLCTNAYHAMREKGGRLTVSLKAVNITPEYSPPVHDMAPGSWYRLTVSDTGCGMRPEVQERIFDPYYTSKPMGEGTGMGLAMVHRIVSNLRGHVTVSSKEGEGSVFHVWLPRIASEDEIAPELPPAEAAGGRERILLVDDEQQIVEMMHKILTGLGYDVTVRYSSPDALEAFRSDPKRFDLVITDQTMPNLTGAEFCRELLRLRPDLRIILCTGFSDLISRKRAFELGIRGFVMKPVNKNELARTIREVLDGEEYAE